MIHAVLVAAHGKVDYSFERLVDKNVKINNMSWGCVTLQRYGDIPTAFYQGKVTTCILSEPVAFSAFAKACLAVQPDCT